MADILASVSVVLGAETSGFRGAMANARRELRGLVQFSEGLKSVGESMSKYVTLPVLAAGAGVLKVGGDFQAAFNRVQAATQAGGAELVALRQKAQNIALDPNLQFSSIQAAQALENLAKNGLSTAQILGGAADASTALATATGGTLAGAADITTDVMNNFGKSADQAAGLVSNITGTTIASKFAIDDYRQALGQAGAVAGQLGVGFEEFNTALGVTSSGFSSGSDAGTSFKTFLQRLVPQSTEAAAAIQQLGLNFFDAQGKIRPLREVAGQLQQAFQGLSDQQRNLLGTQIFGADSIRTALLLAKGGASAFDEMAAAIGKVDAAAQGKILNQGFTGGLEALKSSVEGLAQAIADSGLLAFADRVVRAGADMAASLARLDPAILRAATVFAGLAAATGPVLVAVGSLGVALPALTAGFAALSGPIGISVAALAGAAILIVKNWDSLVSYFGPAGEGGRLFGELATSITASAREISNALTALGSGASLDDLITASGVLKDLVREVAVGFTALSDVVGGTIGAITRLFQGEFTAALREAKRAAEGLFAPLANVLGLSRVQTGDGAGAPSELLLMVTGLDKVKVAAQEAAPALMAFGGSLAFATERTGLLGALEAKLKALKESLPNAQTKDEIASINQQIEATERQVSALESLGKSSKALAQLRAALAQAAGMSTALGDNFDYVKARLAALEQGLEGVLKEGFSDTSKTVRELADEIARLKLLMGDLKPLQLLKPEGVPDKKPVKVASYLEETKTPPLNSVETIESINQLQATFLQFRQAAELTFEQLGKAITLSLGDSIANSVANGTNVLDGLFTSLLGSMEEFMKEYGRNLLLLGAGDIAIGNVVKGGLELAAGAALLAGSGAVARAGGRAGAAPSIPPAFAPAGSSARIGVGQQVLRVEFGELKLRGKELVAAVDSQDYRSKRVRGH